MALFLTFRCHSGYSCMRCSFLKATCHYKETQKGTQNTSMKTMDPITKLRGDTANCHTVFSIHGACIRESLQASDLTPAS